MYDLIKDAATKLEKEDIVIVALDRGEYCWYASMVKLKLIHS